MAVLIDNKDCNTSRKGLGILNCIQELGQPRGFIDIIDSSWKIDQNTETFDLAYVQLEIQKGNFKVFLDANGFEDNSEEDVLQVFSRGVESLVRKGLPKFTFMFVQGYCWHSHAYTHNSERGNIILIWDNAFGFVQSGTDLTSLKRGLLNTGNFGNNNGTEKSKSNISVQLLNADEYNRDMKLLNFDNAGFGIEDIKGIIDANVFYTTNPTDTSDQLSVGVVASCNTAVQVLGLTENEFKVTVDGVSNVVTAAVYNVDTKAYDLTLTSAVAAGNNVIVSLFDGTYDIVYVSDVPYRGVSPSFTVA